MQEVVKNHSPILEHTLVVWLPGIQEMKHNASELVSGCSGRLWFPQLSGDTTKELTEIIVGVV